ncbi:heparan-alpha-glucosaminide N-acetyltransferase [Hydrogenophaga sp. XSHU_21]
MNARYDRIDRLRAVALAWMTVYHFCFDLDFFGVIDQAFLTDPFWTLQRTAIVTLFLFTAGLSQAVALHQGQGWPRFWRRWAQVAGAALLVSAGSWFVFPQSFIYFGVLHGIAVMLVIARLTGHWGRWLWPLGALALGLPWLAPAAVEAWPALASLNQPGLNALGFITQKPFTEDYVPLLPWLGVVWWGLAAGRWVCGHRPGWLGGGGRGGFMAAWGRHSLSFYLLHQPVLMGLIWIALQA